MSSAEPTAGSETAKLDTQVIIVGAGPVGLTTALGLARAGIRSLEVARIGAACR